jgi:hypothetical protein
MQALGACFLEEHFDEGEDFLLYSTQSKALAGGPLERVVARVLQVDIRGVLHASNDLMASLAGQPVTSLRLSQALDPASPAAGVVDLRAAFLHTKFLHFVVLFSGGVPASVAEVRWGGGRAVRAVPVLVALPGTAKLPPPSAPPPHLVRPCARLLRLPHHCLCVCGRRGRELRRCAAGADGAPASAPISNCVLALGASRRVACPHASGRHGVLL